MASIEKAIPTHIPIGHVPKNSVNAPKRLCNIEGNAGEVRPMGATQAIGDPIVDSGEGMDTIGIGPSRCASTATSQKVVNLLH